jgi:hypothetical protein
MKIMSLGTMHGYNFIVSMIIDFDKFQTFHAIVFPTTLHHPCLLSKDAKSWMVSWVNMK